MPTLLTIDSQKENLKIISTLLSEYTVLTAHTHASGVEMVKRCLPDIILLSLNVAILDSITIVKKVKKDNVTKHIPVILLYSKDIDRDIRMKALEYGADAILSVPIDEIELIAMLNLLLRINIAERSQYNKEPLLNDLNNNEIKPLDYGQNFTDNLIETSQVIVLILDNEGHILRFNHFMESVSGFSLNEVKGKDWFTTFLPKGDEDQIRKVFKKALEEKNVFVNINPIITKTGHELLIEWNNKVLRDSDGNIIGILSMGQDITTQYRINEALKKSEERYNLAQRAANIGSWDWDIEKGYLNWTEKIEPMFGFTPGGFKGTYDAFIECVHPEDRHYVLDSTRASIEGVKDYDIEHRILWPQGEVRWVSEKGSVIRNENNKAIRMIGIVQDITERKHREEELNKALDVTQKRQEQVTALLEGARAVLKNRNFHDASKVLFDSCKKLISADSGYVALLTTDANNNQIVYLDPGDHDCMVDSELPMPVRGLREVAYQKKKPVYCNDFSTSPWMTYLPEGHVKLENVLFAPLIIDDQPVGLFGLANKTGGFNEEDVNMARAFGELAAVALINSQTLESLEKSEQRFRSVAHTASDAIISAGSNGNIVLWNKSAEKMFGYTSKDVLGKPITLIMPEQFRKAHEDAFKKVVDTGVSHIIGKRLELAALGKDGHEFPIELSLATWNAGEETFFTGIIRDITDRIEMERALRTSHGELEIRVQERTKELSMANEALSSSEERFRTLVESMDDTVFTLDREQRFVEIFGSWFEESGIPVDRFYGKTMRDVFGSQVAAVHEKSNDRVLGGEHTVYEWSREFPSGTRYFQNSVSPIYDSYGKIEGIVGVKRDVTLQKQLEKKLVHTEKLMVVGEMAAMISHEFRNGLTSVRMILELLYESNNLFDSDLKSLAVALDSINHLESIVKQLLDVSRPAPLTFTPCKLNDIIESSLEIVKTQFDKENIKIRKKLYRQVPLLPFDKNNFREMLINLYLNAIHAIVAKTESTGVREILINTRKVQLEHPIRELCITKVEGHENVLPISNSDPELILSAGTKCVLFEIADTGEGIETKKLSRVFDPFFTTKTSGTGLGLSIVKRIVNAHAGIIQVQSTPGIGTTFIIYLPLPKKEQHYE